jgi:ActR/RegA family two-component response regulator
MAFAVCRGESEKIESKRSTLLLISADDSFYRILRRAANTQGHMVVKAGKMRGLLVVLQTIKPTAALLDLDFPEHQRL